MIRRPPRSTPLSLHDALPICCLGLDPFRWLMGDRRFARLPILIETEKTEGLHKPNLIVADPLDLRNLDTLDRKSTRLNSSHANISYAVFCLKKTKIVASKLSD